MAKHKDFTVAADVQVYFCDPQSPWQRGSNENTNLLLRQYFPARNRPVWLLSSAAQPQRPRKTLGFQTPAAANWLKIGDSSEGLFPQARKQGIR
jgi:IS30 family transposase